MSDLLTIKGRLDEVRRAVLLMGTSVEALGHDEEQDGQDNIMRADIVAAIRATASQAAEHLYWLSLLPETALALPVPDDDEANLKAGAPATTDPEGTTANRRRLVEDAMRRHLAPAEVTR